MTEVFTRWPVAEDGPRPERAKGPVRDMPHWASASLADTGVHRHRWLAILIAFASGLLSCALLTGLVLDLERQAAFFLLGLLAAALTAALVSGGAMRRLAGMRSRLSEGDRRFAEIFERSGLSIWDEDWSAVGEAILALKRRGIHDMRAHFTAHPEEARALRRRVFIRDVNAFTVEMMGAQDKGVFIGPLDIILPNTDQTFIQWLIAFGQGDRFYRSETHILRPDGTAIDVLFTASLPQDLAGFGCILVSCMDISDYKVAQERLVQAETEIARAARVSTVGALTASIAHEVNSPLAAVVSNAQAALRWLDRAVPDIEETRHSLLALLTDASRARQVIDRTRSFLSNTPSRTEAIDLIDTVRSATLLIDRELRALDISLHFDADEHVPLVLADAIQIQQVAVNLMMNGAQAMAALPGPRDLTVTVRSAEGGVRVLVVDRGAGIATSDIGRVFDPFYTTRDQGMGMGLAICKNSVEAHGGRLTVKSAPGEGAAFEFTLPLPLDAA